MELRNFAARPHPDGNRIDLSWTYADPEDPDRTPPPAVRIRRSPRSHPIGLDDGVEVAVAAPGLATDTGLRGETVYYYTLFTPETGALESSAAPNNRVSATATSPYGFADRLYALLPAIYRRYDAAPPVHDSLEPGNLAHGVLRRFLDLPGAQLDQLYSLCRAALNLHDLDRVDGQLLPLLAQWIGWRTDYGLPIGAQRQEIRFAPQIYQRIGTVAAIEATARRLTGLDARTHEFVHNVARTNEPARLSLWSLARAEVGGKWGTRALVSVNFAYEGRIAHVRDDDGADLFFYHTRRIHGWDIWSKKRRADGNWADSRPVVDRVGADKHPAAARAHGKVWLFWEICSPAEAPGQSRWRIAARIRDAAGEVSEPSGRPFGNQDTERRRPSTVVDGDGGLWLFWQEVSDGRWQTKYNRHDGSKWQLEVPATLPEKEGAELHDDLFVLVRPSGPTQQLWLFGARQEPVQEAQTRWTVCYRIKRGLDPANAGDWEAMRTLPKPRPDVHDREPAPLLGADNSLELFFSSTRPATAGPFDGGWSIFSVRLLDPGTNVWGEPEPLTGGPSSQRAPVGVHIQGATLLMYRSSGPIQDSDADGVQTLGTHSSGTTTFSGQQKALYGTFGDIGTYTYTGKGGGKDADGRISRDAIGLFLAAAAPPLSPEEMARAQSRLAAVLPEFLPINARAIVIQP
ncbi:phage tail protein [Arthrobacter humicola]|uniref:phage tail protein n=1 Tax=Arthrobacter humicola TaxID=409291 RepID=UPI001FAD196A|nr:phage tail protein [Arthrobacter humicola]MCI9870541.1 hypothetical protein [Arthrobacter humicola]